jgi:cobalt-precorrin 5A hydrolase
MIVAGFGFRSAATHASLQDALSRAARGQEIDLIATVAEKSRSQCFLELASALSVPLLAVPQAELNLMTTLTVTAAVKRLRGSGSIAEAAALVAAGPGATLLCSRVVSADRMATCAIAKKDLP